ncbi:hypothetical protein [Negadavirga shengliensis]|uniref:LPXTG-motif cell wall-anchored protein n=1 Tax=Negadavirga shengliensis TaxID=1389218 RepID=A0ABV9SZP3_9BACT
MDLIIGALIIVGIAIALLLLFKKIFNKKKDKVSVSQEVSAEEVLKKEVSEFDPATGGEHTDNPEKHPREESDENKEIR